jgi:protein-tyrosine phosphatase
VHGFVDIHSHILYGLDDGAKTLEQSVAMLEMARDSGTTDIVATPHANVNYAFQPDVIAARVAELNASVPGITIHRGCDFHLQIDNIEDALAHPRKYTINGHGYLMVEFPTVTVFPDTERLFEQLLDAGMRPIITHPERQVFLQRKPELLAAWVDAGCALQVTAASFMGLFGPRPQAAARELMRRRLVHVVASDAHDENRRTPDLRPAYEALCAEWGEDDVRPLFVDNPRAVLTGDDMPFVGLPVPPPIRPWWQFWRG